MPTGYTAKIAEGVLFPEFAMNCARAFGALITMRDEPSDAPIPEKFEPTYYHAKAVTEARARQAQLEVITPAMAGLKAEREYSAALERHEAYKREKRELSDKYTAMLDQVNAWQPPTPEHQGLKDFMAEQIRESIRFDCTVYEDSGPKLLTGDEWLANEHASIKRDIDYHSKKHLEEVERVNGRTQWVKALRESLA